MMSASSPLEFVTCMRNELAACAAREERFVAVRSGVGFILFARA